MKDPLRITTLTRKLRWLRRAFSRSEWTVRILGLPRSKGRATEPGLIRIRLPGNAETWLDLLDNSRSVAFMRRLVQREGYQRTSIHDPSGLANAYEWDFDSFGLFRRIFIRAIYFPELFRAWVESTSMRRALVSQVRTTIRRCADAARGVDDLMVDLTGHLPAEELSQLTDKVRHRLARRTDRAVQAIWRVAHMGTGREYDFWILLGSDYETTALLPADIALVEKAADGKAVINLQTIAGELLGTATGVTTKRAVRDEDCVRIMTYNVHACVGMDGMLEPRRVARVIAQANPDIICLQELDVFRARSDKVDQAHEIARYLEIQYQFHPAWHIEEEQFGNAVLTHLPMRIIQAEGLHHHKADRSRRSALWVEIEMPSEQRLQVINAHISMFPKEQLIQARELLNDWAVPAMQNGPVILCGDFNATPGSATHKAIATGMHCVESFDAEASQKTYFSPFPVARLDHIFVSEGMKAESVQAVKTRLARIASDHVPLIADLRIMDAENVG